MQIQKPRYSPVLRAVALLGLIAGMAIMGFVSLISALSHDESREREELKKAMQELHKK